MYSMKIFRGRKGFKHKKGWGSAWKVKKGSRSSSSRGGVRRASSVNSDSLSVSEWDTGDGFEIADEGEEGAEVAWPVGGCKFKIYVTSYTRFHTDPDNIFPKYFIDELVRAGILPDDSSRYISSIEKEVIIVKEKNEERTKLVVRRSDV